MAQAIRDSGIRNYSIFFRGDGVLFAYLEAEDPSEAFAFIARQEVNERWQRAMARFFLPLHPGNDDAMGQPETLGPEMEELEEVFHIE